MQRYILRKCRLQREQARRFVMTGELSRWTRALHPRNVRVYLLNIERDSHRLKSSHNVREGRWKGIQRANNKLDLKT